MNRVVLLIQKTLAFPRFNVAMQMRKGAPTYQIPRSDHRATTEPALLVTSLKWPPLLPTL